MSFRNRRIPLWVCVPYTAFVAWMVHNYWTVNGPSNFLFFCDFGSLVTCVGLWIESPLLLGTEAVALVVLQSIWVLDLFVRLTGHPMSGMTEYMFVPDVPESSRLISTFHAWLPMLLVWAVNRVGYDRRSFGVQCVVGTVLLVACFRLTGRDVNINYVWGPPDRPDQPWMPPVAWLGVVIATTVVAFYVPAHLVFRWRIKPPPRPPRLRKAERPGFPVVAAD